LKRGNLDDARCVVLTSDQWTPAYRSGDALLLQDTDAIRVNDHVAVIGKGGDVHLAALQKQTMESLTVMLLGREKISAIIPRAQIATVYRIAAVMKV
jgi:hypothetical protein